MADKNSTHKKFGISLNWWIYEKLKLYADDNGMSIRAAVRFIINQFFKKTI